MAPSRKKPRVELAKFLDDTAVEALESAQAALDAVPDDKPDQRQRAAVDAARQRVQDTTITYRCQGLGATQYRALLAEHPATDEDHAQTNAIGAGRARWSIEGFPKALIRASVVDPALTADDVEQMFTGQAWNDAELEHLFNKALRASTTVSHLATTIDG